LSKILITGGAGFLGFFLTKKLSEHSNNQITLVDNLLRGKMDMELQELIAQKNVQFIQGDLTDPRLFMHLDKDYQYLYHLAAVIGVKNVMQNPEKVLYTNAVSTLNVFEYAKHTKSLKKLFYASTSEVYAGTLKY
jgi:nucleoside-diphosphate-sugar epimerase